MTHARRVQTIKNAAVKRSLRTMVAKHWNEQWLRETYWDWDYYERTGEWPTMYDVADETDVSASTIRTRLRKFNIPRRGRFGRRKEREHNHRDPFWLKDAYETEGSLEAMVRRDDCDVNTPGALRRWMDRCNIGREHGDDDGWRSDPSVFEDTDATYYAAFQSERPWEDEDTLRTLYDEHGSVKAIARQFDGVGRKTIERAIHDAGIDAEPKNQHGTYDDSTPKHGSREWHESDDASVDWTADQRMVEA